MKLLHDMEIETHLVMTKAAALTAEYELGARPADIAALADYKYGAADVGASVASGSFKTLGMLVAPCSMRSLAEIATGMTSGLLTRAADVALKERRRLVLLTRETPLHAGHLRMMLQATENGAVIMPPTPAFYANLTSIDDMVEQTVCRALDLFDLDAPRARRWGEDLEKGRR